MDSVSLLFGYIFSCVLPFISRNKDLLDIREKHGHGQCSNHSNYGQCHVLLQVMYVTFAGCVQISPTVGEVQYVKGAVCPHSQYS